MAQNADTREIGQQVLYPLDDPETAFRNAMRDVGINPMRANPFVGQLMKAAPGARIAYLATGRPESGVLGNPSQGYGQFLRNQLGAGTLFSNMTHVAGNMSEVTNALKQWQDMVDNGNLQQVTNNPLYTALNDILSANGGMGALSAYAQLRTPMLGAIAPSFTRATQAAGEGVTRSFANNANPSDSIWDWIFRGPRGAF